MGGGIIIQQRNVVKQTANDPSMFDQLCQSHQDRVRNISAKGVHDWTDDEDSFMRMVPVYAKPHD